MSAKPFTFEAVLTGELEEIEQSRKRRVPEIKPAPPEDPSQADPYKKAHDAQLLGVAFSGGGIRSATFNLGILQALADMDILRWVDYLSTVSGGGYIGSWLAAWIKRQPGGTAGSPVQEVQSRLDPVQGARHSARTSESHPLSAAIQQLPHAPPGFLRRGHLDHDRDLLAQRDSQPGDSHLRHRHGSAGSAFCWMAFSEWAESCMAGMGFLARAHHRNGSCRLESAATGGEWRRSQASVLCVAGRHPDSDRRAGPGGGLLFEPGALAVHQRDGCILPRAA